MRSVFVSPARSLSANPTLLIALSATAVLAVILIGYRKSLVRGLTDVGFVGNALRAERARRNGL
jgi:hypothetical protein